MIRLGEEQDVAFEEPVVAEGEEHGEALTSYIHSIESGVTVSSGCEKKT